MITMTCNMCGGTCSNEDVTKVIWWSKEHPCVDPEPHESEETTR